MSASPARQARREAARRGAPVATEEVILNAYACDTCHEHTVTRSVVVSGRIPSQLECLAGDKPGDCGGAAAALPPGEWPEGLPRTPAWEWYSPGGGERRVLRQEGGPVWAHVVTGGLLLRAFKGASS